MAAGTWNFTVEQGATFKRVLSWSDANGTPVPLAGKQARMQLRAKQADPDPPLLELTTENGRITLVDPGVIQLDLTSDDTMALSFKTAAYDLEIVDPSTTPETVTRLVQGVVTLSAEVTR